MSSPDFSLEVTRPLSAINGVRRRRSLGVFVPIKRSKSLAGTPKATYDQVAFDLHEAHVQQTHTPTGVQTNALDSPVIIADWEVPLLDVGMMEDFVRTQLMVEDRTKHPIFVEGDLDPEESDDIASLQKYHMCCERRGDKEGAIEVQNKLLEIFIANNECLHTPFGDIVTKSETVCRWALLYSSLYCANPLCHQPLTLEDTHNDYLKKLVFYELPCVHAARFCENCAQGTLQCTMCTTRGKSKKPSYVYQKVGGAGTRHVNCFNNPCSDCKPASVLVDNLVVDGLKEQMSREPIDGSACLAYEKRGHQEVHSHGYIV